MVEAEFRFVKRRTELVRVGFDELVNHDEIVALTDLGQ